MAMTPEQALRLAMEYHRSGRWAEAEAVCRQILVPDPRHAPALHLLGILAGEAGRPDVAIELIGRAIGIAPRVADYHNNLGESYRRLGQWDKAVVSLRRAIELNRVQPVWLQTRRDRKPLASRRIAFVQPCDWVVERRAEGHYWGR